MQRTEMDMVTAALAANGQISDWVARRITQTGTQLFLIGAEPENPLILGNETKIGIDDRKGSIFRQLGKKLR